MAVALKHSVRHMNAVINGLHGEWVKRNRRGWLMKSVKERLSLCVCGRVCVFVRCFVHMKQHCKSSALILCNRSGKAACGDMRH